MSKLKFILSYAALLILVLSPLALAQSSRGTVTGTITDPSGAVIAGATVKLINVQTNVTREITSNEQGAYRFETVDPGTYKVEVSASGFKRVALDNIPVGAAQTVNTSVKLEVGIEGDILEITAGAEVTLQTEDSARVSTLNSKEIVDLPIGTLNPVDLVFTLPGVLRPGSSGGFVQGTEFSINGLRPRANNQLIDGTDNNDNSITGQAYQPQFRDAFQEVSVNGATNSAEYGRAGGAVINLITRGGTNEYHGSIYDIISPSALFSLSSGDKLIRGLKSVPVEIQNQYGFSLGGPIKKEKFFFFSSFQANPFRTTAVTPGAVVPTAAGFATLRNLFPAGRSANLDRYLSVVGDLRGQTLLRNIPLGGGRPDIQFGSASRTTTQPVDSYQFVTRLDYVLSAKDSITGRILFDDQTFENQFPTSFTGFEIDVPSRVQNYYVNYNRIISPRITNEFRFAYGRFNALFTQRNQSALDFGPTFGFGGTSVTGVGLGAGFPQGRVANNYQFQDTININLGAHNVTAGVDLLRQITRQAVPFNGRGALTFTSGGGFPTFGNFVDGFSGTQGVFANIVFGSPLIRPNAFQQSYFVQDDWKARQNLTINAGLRYENFGTPFNVAKFPSFAGFDQPITTVVKQQRDDNNFSPRFGFAYSPRFARSIFGEDKTVFRGSIAITYDVFFNNILSNTAATSPNVAGAAFNGSQGGTPRGFANAGSNTLPTSAVINPLAGVNTIDRDLVAPQSYTFSFGMQRELPFNLIGEVSYVGTRGTRLFTNEQINPGVNNRRIVPTRGGITVRTNGGDSIYHSLQTRVDRSFKNGISARFAYTFSRTIDNTSEVFTTSGGSSFVADAFNRSLDRGVSSFHAKHRATVTYNWELPGPKTGVLGQVLGGYNVSGIYNVQSGAVETPFVGGLDLNGDLNAFNDRPAISNPNAPANTVAFDGSFFGAPRGTFFDLNGNPISPSNTRFVVFPGLRASSAAARNSLKGDRLNRMDFSVRKSIKMPFENHKLELRLDFFNVFNHAFFTFDGAVSDGDVLNENFNNVKLNNGGRRTGRVELRYTF